MTTPEKVLFVDDDENLLSGMRRQLRGKFDLHTANGGQAALDLVGQEGPFAVVIADMRMPGMDGVAFLEKFARVSPETVRMMLTGNADQNTAVMAINKGNIFRFFNKPCEPDLLEAGVRDGIRQYQLITAERTLIEQTLAGSVKVLTDVLAQLNPLVFGRAMKVKGWCDKVAREVGYPQPWELGLAALLSPIGMVSLPAEILGRIAMEKPLQPLERDIVRRTPEVARKLVINIPRLENVAEIIYLQNRNFDGTGFPPEGPLGPEIPLGARILRILNRVALTADLEPTAQDFDNLLQHKGHFDPALLSQLRGLLAYCDELPEEELPPEGREMVIPLRDLRVNDYLLTDLETTDDHVLLAHGMTITKSQLQRLRTFQRIHTFREPIEIRRGGPAPNQKSTSLAGQENGS